MTTPHKHAALIKAWADGAEIEHYYALANDWKDSETPLWEPRTAYRIKHIPKQDTFEYRCVQQGFVAFSSPHEKANVKLTYDGETGQLKSAEVIK